jgi:phage baseplate assembly protein V
VHSSYISERDAVRTMLRRAAIVAVDDAGEQQLVNVSGFKSDKPKKIPRVESFGFASAPPVGGTGLIVCLGGRSDKAMFVGGEHAQYRPKNLPSGAVQVYDASNQYLGLLPNGVKLVCATPLTIIAPAGATIQGNTTIQGNLAVAGEITWSNGVLAANATIDGNLTATGTITGEADVIANGHSGASHTHAAPGGETGPPVG